MASSNPVARYLDWLHLRWPAGTVEKLPEVQPDGATAVAGLYVVGDLTGVPLLKFSADSGARASRGWPPPSKRSATACASRSSRPRSPSRRS